MSSSSLAAERTLLAWRRTALAVAVGSLVAGRLLGPALGWAAWAVAGAGLVAAGAALAAAQRSGHDERTAPPIGALAAACACGALLVGLASVAYVALART